MNKIILVGRFTRDPEVKYTDGGTSISRFTIAVDRRFKQDGGPEADFPNCVAFGKTAEFIEKYFHKGMKIGIIGRIQTGSYTNNDGQKIYITDVVVEECYFVESKSVQIGKASHQTLPEEPPLSELNDNFAGFAPIPDSIDEELPFN